MRSATLALAPILLALATAPAFGADVDVSASTCANCHEEQATAFMKGPHGLAMAKLSPATLERSCATCHGPMEAHVENPEKTNVNRNPGPEACLKCHAATGSLQLSTGTHARGKVDCLGCHVSGHAAPAAQPLMKKKGFDLCGSCHAEQARASRLPFAHRQSAQPFDCRTCHSVHGKNLEGRLRLTGNGGVCVDCHNDKAGPFAYPHPPREAGNGCMACHKPHGSTFPKMLTRGRVLSLCLECHTKLPALHDVRSSRYTACQSCHVAIHGSNRNSHLFDE